MANTTVYPFGTGGQLPSSIGIIDDLVTGGSDKALSARMGKELGEIVNELLPLLTLRRKYENLMLGGTISNQYLDVSNDTITINSYANAVMVKVEVKADTCYYINRGTKSNNSNKSNYVALMDDENNLSVPLNKYGEESSISLNRVSPNSGVIKTRSSTKYLLIVLSYTSGHGNSINTNEYCIETDTVVLPEEYYDVLNNVRLDYTKLPCVKKSLKVLLIGSSYGINSIMALPPLAKAAGMDLVVGNLYQSSVTMAEIAGRMNDTDKWKAYGYFDSYGLVYCGDASPASERINPRVTKNTTYQALQDEAWDVVIIQRSAAESPTEWTSGNTTSANTIIDYITENCPSHPKILLNTTFAHPLGQSDTSTRAAQQATTTAIINAAKTAKQEVGIDFINVAKAIQLCRDDETINTGDSDLTNGTVHLNSGIGMYITACCMLEYFGAMFGISVRTQTHIHTADELVPVCKPASTASLRYPIMGDNLNTWVTPTDAQAALIRKYAQMSVRDV